MKEWYIVGYFPSGEALYCSSEGDFAKENEYNYFVNVSMEDLKKLKIEVSIEDLKKLKSEIDN